jgi:hypothetical protein
MIDKELAFALLTPLIDLLCTVGIGLVAIAYLGIRHHEKHQ